MDNFTMDLVREYAPILYFDTLEPFFPVRVGVTVLDKPGASPSFRRSFDFQAKDLKYVIEYAIYWDYDIQHLYELEHVWIYVDQEGHVVDCDASFHGRYFKGLLRDGSNLEGTHVKLYSQPGKHAFLPDPEMFYLIPDLMECTKAEAHKRGLIVTGAFDGIYESNEEKDRLVNAELTRNAFTPSMEFQEYRLDPSLLVTWEQLKVEVPQRIEACIEQLRGQE